MALRKVWNIVKWVTNPVGTYTQKVVEGWFGKDSAVAQVANTFVTAPLGVTPLLNVVNVIDYQNNIIADADDKAEMSGVPNGKDYIDGFTPANNIVVRKNTNGTITYPVVQNLFHAGDDAGYYCEGVTVDGWGKHPKILDILRVGKWDGYFDKTNSTYAIPFLIAMWNNVYKVKEIEPAMENGFMKYLDAVFSRPYYTKHYGEDFILVNERINYGGGVFDRVFSLCGSDGKPNGLKTDGYKNWRDAVENPIVAYQGGRGYSRLYDYKLDLDGRIVDDKTEPNFAGVEDFVYVR